ncbi:hypothetical protein Patl1_06570 [Pistacia atlantica]|uniref:Uncharacterized protein n=1 Tax=Pistacia atlantica TaxID=434234 RepID=A0ACC1BT96_9ROSI|nr:hypothetical protein Patl1_06570 [Pistacia atlantica]
MGKQISIQGDLYSYGILLLELLTAKRSADDMFKDGKNLHRFTRMVLSNHVMDIVDPRLLLEEDMTEKKQAFVVFTRHTIVYTNLVNIIISGRLGLAKFLSKISSGYVNEQSSTVIIKGTTGYVAPRVRYRVNRSLCREICKLSDISARTIYIKETNCNMFKEDLNLQNLTRKALPDQVINIGSTYAAGKRHKEAGVHDLSIEDWTFMFNDKC